jgi:hypothetical protein
VLEDKGLRNYGMDAARTEQVGQGSYEMDKKNNHGAGIIVEVGELNDIRETA